MTAGSSLRAFLHAESFLRIIRAFHLLLVPALLNNLVDFVRTGAAVLEASEPADVAERAVRPDPALAGLPAFGGLVKRVPAVAGQPAGVAALQPGSAGRRAAALGELAADRPAVLQHLEVEQNYDS